MCGHFGLSLKIKKITENYNINEINSNNVITKYKSIDDYKEKCYNLSPGDLCPIITNLNNSKLQFYRFGFTPSWSEKSTMVINARAEGDKNPENNSDYKGAKGIINKIFFKKAIRSQRCLVIADYYIEGTTDKGLEKPYVVYLRNKMRPFSMAGIWDSWQNKNGETIYNFAIITTTANQLIKKLPHHRMPVILSRNDEVKWLSNNASLSDITQLLQPFNDTLMNAYPVKNDIKSPKAKGRALIEPIGEKFFHEIEASYHLEKKGFGNPKKK